eukprot:CAMPEP_0117551482 /NCGR_PEP_ID=MMETSP0784-20121206/49214_1 /TAXON_ID=39447 /ORGANISM="" /LENGTH=341 /DNA_ID=CAMNT_0005348523 /DNA_START=57 /DNA_END=1079 /DNA_ORIENTATION=+
MAQLWPSRADCEYACSRLYGDHDVDCELLDILESPAVVAENAEDWPVRREPSFPALTGGLVDLVLTHCIVPEALRLSAACGALRRRLLLAVGGREDLKLLLGQPVQDRWYLQVHDEFTLHAGSLRRYWEACYGRYSVLACVRRRRALLRLAAEFLEFAGPVGVDWLSILVAAQPALAGIGRLRKSAVVCAAQVSSLLPLGADRDMDLMRGTHNCFSAAHGELTLVLALETGVLCLQHNAFACGLHACCDILVGIHHQDGSFSGGYSRESLERGLTGLQAVTSPCTITTAASVDGLRADLGPERRWMLGLGNPTGACEAALERGLTFVRWIRRGGLVHMDRV